MSKFVLDASAVLALMFSENGKEQVEAILDDSVISRINVTEILTKLVENGSSIENAVRDIAEIELTIREFNEAQSISIADLRMKTKHLVLSLGDRACLALAIEENATAVTADKSWAKLSVCPVEVIR